MSNIRQIVELGRSGRAEAGVKLRQPLGSVTIVGSLSVSAEPWEKDIISRELNVKQTAFKPGEGDLLVRYDLTLTEDLKLEGQARELVREIQSQRKKIGCGFADKINVVLPEKYKKLLENYGQYIKDKVLANELVLGDKMEVRSVDEPD